jgi:hypothetical protein
VPVLLLVLLIGSFALFWNTTIPTLKNGMYQYENRPSLPFEHPLKVTTRGPSFTVDIDLDLPLIHPHTFRVTPDDCLLRLEINGTAIEDVRLPSCNFNGIALDLGDHLQRGTNHIRAEIKDTGGLGRFSIMPLARKDPLLLSARILLAAGILFVGFFKLR